MPDIAGAMAAIEQRLADNWTNTPIAKPNEAPADPWPPVSATTGNNAPWVLIEVINTTSDLRAVGSPGDQFWLYRGLVIVHVFVPTNSGVDLARQYASQIGEIFRNKVFYNDTDGFQVRTLSPFIDGIELSTVWGGSPRLHSDPTFGAWYRSGCTVPFEYYHRG